MQTIERPAHRIDEAERPLWLGGLPRAWDGVLRTIDPNEAQDAASMIDTAGLGWSVEQCPLEAVLAIGDDGYPTRRAHVPRHVANVRTDTGAVLGVVGDGYEPLQNGAAFAFCDDITDSGRAHWIGAGAARGGARVHALMKLDREIRIGGAEGEDVLPLLCFRNGHDGGLAVTVSVAPFRLACLNGMLLPLDGAQRVWKARHTAHVQARLVDARRTLGIAWRYYDELEEVGGQLIRHTLGESEFERFLARLVPLPERKPDRSDGGRAVRNAERVREAIRAAYRFADDLDNVRGTSWGALQAVTAYVDHTQPTRQTAGRTHAEARFERATEPQALKDRALALLTEGGPQT